MARTKAFEETEVLDKIQKLFWRKGFNGTSVDDLVKESGLSRSSLYDTFGDKEKLFHLSLKKYRDENTSQMLTMIEGSNDIKKTIQSIFDYVFDDIEEQNKLGCLMVNTAIELAPHKTKIAKMVDENMEVLHAALTHKIKQAQKARQVKTNLDASAFAALLINTLNGIRVGERHQFDKKKQKSAAKLIIDLL